MPDSFTEHTSTSWFSRLRASVTGVLFGGLLFLVAFPLLFWNEGRAVKTARSLDEGQRAVVSVEAGAVDAAREGDLIHLTGLATVTGSITDPMFGVTAPALKLRRVVEMYQWEEATQSKTEKELGGSTETTKTYTYRKTWSARHLPSERFKEPSGHENPAAMPYEAWEAESPDATVGAYRLSPRVLAALTNYERLILSASDRAVAARKPGTRIHNNTLYTGDPDDPQIGDARITFEVVKPGPVSLVAQQDGDSFMPYTTSNGRTIHMVEAGTYSANAMFASAGSSNTLLTWLLRGLGFILMGAGLSMVFRPIAVVADVVPFLGTLLERGLGFVAFAIATVCALTTIALGWIAYRPLLGITLLVLAGAVIGGLIWLRRGADEPRPQTAPQPAPLA